MRILIISPSIFPEVTGNAITTERWRRSLQAQGIAVEVLSSDKLNLFLECLNHFHPDVIHVHHAFKTASILLDPIVASTISSIPIVVSPGGTDINLDNHDPDKRKTTIKILRMARIILAQNDATVWRLQELLPERTDRILVIPKAFCWFGDESCDLRSIAGCDPGDILFFLPAGIRPVKGNLECLQLMKRVHELRPKIRFIAAGPAIEADYAGLFEQEVKRHPQFARWIGCLPPAAMHSAFKAADIVLNTSFSEGLSNSLLESIAAGRPVLASDIPGNRHPVLGEAGDQPAGFLYDLDNADDFIRKAISLIDDEGLRNQFSRAAQTRKNRIPNPADEALGLIAAYQKALRIVT